MRTAVLVITAIGCAGLALAALATLRWGDRAFVDDTATNRPVGRDVRWWLRLVTVHLTGGLLAGLLVAGLGGRLAMRIIAATSGRAAQGRITEADEVIGAITVEGTIGFLVFVGLGAGMLAALIYLVLRPLLPSGHLGGLLLGVFILVVAATRLDPLRADNPDFDIVGPDLLSLSIFGVLPLLLGTTVAAITNRLSASVSLIDSSPRTWAPHLALVPAVLVPPVAVTIVAGGAVVIAARRLAASVPRARAVLVARVAAIAIALLALPGFVVSIADIATG